MKIAVSTIAKNEADNVKGFVESCKEADLVSVLDTGSTDGTQELLKKYNVFAGEKKIEPWDFGKARNEALKRLPQDVDVVVSIDLDERLQPDWRKALEEIWQPDSEAVSYRYVVKWQDKEQKVPAIVTWRSKIFRRKGFEWFNPVHELPLLKGKKMPKLVLAEKITVEHHQKGERDYTELLTKWLKETPDYEDGYIQRGADYIKMEKYQEAIRDYQQYLELTRNEQKNCGNPACERCLMIGGRRAYSHIEIARAKHKLGFAPYEIIKHFLKAVAEAPDLREAWTYLADGFYSVGNYPAAYGAAMTALQITNPGIHAQEMICWADYPKNIADSAFSRILSGASGTSQFQQPMFGQQFPQKQYRIGQPLSDQEPGEYLKTNEMATGIIKQEVEGKVYNMRVNKIDRLVLSEVVIFKEYSKYLHLTKDDIWLDIGGHIGTFSIDISDKVNKVFTFEPEPGNYSILEKNIAENKIENITTFNEAVVGNDDKEREFHLDESRDTGGHSFIAAEGKAKIMVKCRNINDILKTYNINKVKLDCEGAEYEIIKKMDPTNIKEVIMEFHFYLLGLTKFEKLVACLRKSFDVVQTDKTTDPDGRLIKIYCKKLT